MKALLKDKVCLITGAGKGIGRAIVKRFAEEGALVIAVDREHGSMDSSDIDGPENKLYYDISEESNCKKIAKIVQKEFGRLDVLINNAGVMRDALIGTITKELIDEVYATNVYGTMFMLQNAAKFMMRQRSGSIVNLSSVVGITGNPGQLVYSSTKGAIISMTKTAAKELGPRGIRVNAIAPGMIDTDMMQSVGEEHLAKHIANIPCGRLGYPNEIADAAVFLASDMSSYVNGHILSVDADVLV